jgi:hypothetical protein
MDALGGDQRETIPKVESYLATKHASCSGAGSVLPSFARVSHLAQQI